MSRQAFATLAQRACLFLGQHSEDGLDRRNTLGMIRTEKVTHARAPRVFVMTSTPTTCTQGWGAT
jgi:hypothetical protein